MKFRQEATATLACHLGKMLFEANENFISHSPILLKKIIFRIRFPYTIAHTFIMSNVLHLLLL